MGPTFKTSNRLCIFIFIGFAILIKDFVNGTRGKKVQAQTQTQITPYSYSHYTEIQTMTPNQCQSFDKFKNLVKGQLPHTFMKEDIFLVKYLMANNFNIQTAKTHLLESLKWRQTNRIDDALVNPSAHFGNMMEEYPIYVDGYDKRDRPICEIPLGAWNVRKAANAGKAKDLANHMIVNCAEKASAKVRQLQSEGKNVTQWILLMNMEGYHVVTHACIRCITMARPIIMASQRYFPLQSFGFWLVNTPGPFGVLLKIIAPFMSAITRDRIKIFGKNDAQWKPFMLNHIDRGQISSWFGGLKERLPLRFLSHAQSTSDPSYDEYDRDAPHKNTNKYNDQNKYFDSPPNITVLVNAENPENVNIKIITKPNKDGDGKGGHNIAIKVIPAQHAKTRLDEEKTGQNAQTVLQNQDSASSSTQNEQHKETPVKTENVSVPNNEIKPAENVQNFKTEADQNGAKENTGQSVQITKNDGKNSKYIGVNGNGQNIQINKVENSDQNNKFEGKQEPGKNSKYIGVNNGNGQNIQINKVENSDQNKRTEGRPEHQKQNQWNRGNRQNVQRNKIENTDQIRYEQDSRPTKTDQIRYEQETRPTKTDQIRYEQDVRPTKTDQNRYEQETRPTKTDQNKKFEEKSEPERNTQYIQTESYRGPTVQEAESGQDEYDMDIETMNGLLDPDYSPPIEDENEDGNDNEIE